MPRGLYSAFVLPALRVRMDARGVISPCPRGDIGPQDSNSLWWEAVLRDVRAGRKSDHHFDTLGGATGETIDIECAQCDLKRTYLTAEVRKMFPATYRMVYLRFDLACCPAEKKLRECAVRYSNKRERP